MMMIRKMITMMVTKVIRGMIVIMVTPMKVSDKRDDDDDDDDDQVLPARVTKVISLRAANSISAQFATTFAK